MATCNAQCLQLSCKSLAEFLMFRQRQKSHFFEPEDVLCSCSNFSVLSRGPRVIDAFMVKVSDTMLGQAFRPSSCSIHFFRALYVDSMRCVQHHLCMDADVYIKRQHLEHISSAPDAVARCESAFASDNVSCTILYMFLSFTPGPTDPSTLYPQHTPSRRHVTTIFVTMVVAAAHVDWVWVLDKLFAYFCR